MPITALPTPPQRSDPANFAARADAFFAALANFVTQFNAMVPQAVAGAVTGSFTVSGQVNFGSGAVVTDAAGNVGLGTSSPTAALDVSRVGLGGNCSFFVRAGAGANANIDLAGGGNTAGGTSFLLRQDLNGDALVLNRHATGNLILGTNGFGSARIDSSGNFLAGVTSGSFHRLVKNNSSNYAAEVYNQSGASGYGLSVSSASTAATGATWNHIDAFSNSVSVFRVGGQGNVTNTNNSYGAISDIKLKEDITDASPKLEDLMRVRVVNYKLKDQPEVKQLGVIAQELELIFPGLVEESHDSHEITKTHEVEVPAVLGEDGEIVSPATVRQEEYTERELTGEVTKSVKYSVFVPMLIKAVQEQQALIDRLTTRVAVLEQAS
ncbi:tail fiber domain-containing protein [Paucibacter sp. TC2R-5]|uniref:tail fiber domain-containing protein n=1 Tax=Paucibacter sp. TC2R-5 TaxID=2893555 RepID=UPI0021E44FE1|nr:tail fiber domain-containing protein [Paucibacter sp. TC2R-5]MCV2359626.1 tail fiber domain-containing protein [Paucibacter sp. TC2R-5]